MFKANALVPSDVTISPTASPVVLATVNTSNPEIFFVKASVTPEDGGKLGAALSITVVVF